MPHPILRALAFAIALACAATAQAQPSPAEPEDAFVLQIDVGRHSVFVDKAFAAIGAEIPFVFIEGPAADEPADSAPAIWRALRQTGRDAVIAKELYCAKGLLGRQTCANLKPPLWIGAEPTPVPSYTQLRAHEIALSIYMEPVVGRACALGRAKFKDPMFCSVE